MDGRRDGHEARGRERCGILGESLLLAQLARQQSRLIHEVDGTRRGQLLGSTVTGGIRLVTALARVGRAQREI